MFSRKLILWLAFIASGAIAYPLVFWEAFWPLGRVIAGWYAILVIVVVVAAGILALSIKWGAVQYRPGFFDLFIF
ncbi:MAG: hypothetical protein WBK19_14770 [Azonexus sp.]